MIDRSIWGKMLKYLGLRGFGSIFVLLVVSVMLAACKDSPDIGMEQSHSKPAYTVPSEIALDFTVERGSGGELFIVGTTNLPDGLKLGAEVGKTTGPGVMGQDYNIFVHDGRFRSEGFTNDFNPIPRGKRKISVLTRFNVAWQTSDILRIVGIGGAKINGKVLTLEDPDVVDSDKKIEITRVIDLPSLIETGDPKAIGIVKRATLSVDGSRSSTDVERTIRFFTMNTPGFRSSGGWSSTITNGTKATVTFDFIDGGDGEKQAIWEVDRATQKVRYVNKSAKLLSWNPSS